MRRSQSNAQVNERIVQECQPSRAPTEIDLKNTTDGGYLTCRGSSTGYYYLADGANVHVFSHSPETTSLRKILSHNFGKSCTVKDVKFFRLNETTPGILVLYRRPQKDVEKGCLLSCISLQSKTVIKTCYIPLKGTTLEVCLDGAQITEAGVFKEALRTVQNLVAVGGQESRAALVNMGAISEEEADPDPVPPVRFIQILTPNENGLMEYSTDVTGRNICYFHGADEDVSSICYMFTRQLVIMGLSNGVMFHVSLQTGDIRSQEVSNGSALSHMLVQHPIDDSDGCVYLWVVCRRSGTRPLHLCLFSSMKYNQTTVFAPRMRYVPYACERFFGIRTVVLTAQQAAKLGISDTSENTTMEQNGLVKESARYNQLLMFLYLEGKPNSDSSFLRGCVFDLNGYYSQRMPPEPMMDRKVAFQCGFMSHFRAKEDPKFSNESVMDFIVNSISNFERPGTLQSHLDQLFFPSSLNFSFDILSNCSLSRMRVFCLQNKVLEEVKSNIVEFFNEPQRPSHFLHEIGLTNSLPVQDDLMMMRASLFRVLLHNHFPGLMKVLHMSTLNNEMLLFINTWIEREVYQSGQRLNDEVDDGGLFERARDDIPKPTMDFLLHSQVMFRRASQVYDELAKRLAGFDDTDEDVLPRLEDNRKMCEDLSLFTSALMFGLEVDLLRDTPENTEQLESMRLTFGSRFTIARKLDQELEIHQLFGDIIEITEKNPQRFRECFGDRQTPADFYPPENFRDLLPVLRHFYINTNVKLQIVGYFAKDLDSVLPSNAQMYFRTATSYLLNEQMSPENVSLMSQAWITDQRLLKINMIREVPGMLELRLKDEITEKDYKEEDLRFVPCTTVAERDKLLQMYMTFPDGVHRFNMEMISRRRFEMVVDPPEQVESIESEFVRTARDKVAEVKRIYAHRFVKNAFPQPILDACKRRATMHPKMHVGGEAENQRIIPLGVSAHPQKRLNVLASRDPISSQMTIVDVADDEEDERRAPRAFPQTSTPRGDQSSHGVSVFMDGEVTPPQPLEHLLPHITPPSHRMHHPPVTPRSARRNIAGNESLRPESARKPKDEERIWRITTPQSSRRRISRFAAGRKRPANSTESPSTPESAAVIQKPTSILRTNPKRPRVNAGKGIKFVDDEAQVRLIPTNAENRERTLANSSFTELFAASTDESSMASVEKSVEFDDSSLLIERHEPIPEEDEELEMAERSASPIPPPNFDVDPEELTEPESEKTDTEPNSEELFLAAETSVGISHAAQTPQPNTTLDQLSEDDDDNSMDTHVVEAAAAPPKQPVLQRPSRADVTPPSSPVKTAVEIEMSPNVTIRRSPRRPISRAESHESAAEAAESPVKTAPRSPVRTLNVTESPKFQMEEPAPLPESPPRPVSVAESEKAETPVPEEPEPSPPQSPEKIAPVVVPPTPEAELALRRSPRRTVQPEKTPEPEEPKSSRRSPRRTLKSASQSQKVDEDMQVDEEEPAALRRSPRRSMRSATPAPAESQQLEEPTRRSPRRTLKRTESQSQKPEEDAEPAGRRSPRRTLKSAASQSQKADEEEVVENDEPAALRRSPRRLRSATPASESQKPLEEVDEPTATRRSPRRTLKRTESQSQEPQETAATSRRSPRRTLKSASQPQQSVEEEPEEAEEPATSRRSPRRAVRGAPTATESQTPAEPATSRRSPRRTLKSASQPAAPEETEVAAEEPVTKSTRRLRSATPAAGTQETDEPTPKRRATRQTPKMAEEPEKPATSRARRTAKKTVEPVEAPQPADDSNEFIAQNRRPTRRTRRQ